MMELNKIYNMDCLEGMKDMPRPDLIVTDPPYEFEAMGGGVHRVGSGGAVKYQDIIDIGTNHFDFDKFVPALLDLQKDKVNAYFFCNKVLVPKYLNEATKRGLNFDILALRKVNPLPAKASSYMPELEYIIFLRSPGVLFNNHYSIDHYKKVFDVKIGHSTLVHPNQKPKELIKRFIKISSAEGGIVFDPFMGSGTTALACKELKRQWIGFEISKKYCDIAEKRLAQEQLEVFA